MKVCFKIVFFNIRRSRLEILVLPRILGPHCFTKARLKNHIKNVLYDMTRWTVTQVAHKDRGRIQVWRETRPVYRADDVTRVIVTLHGRGHWWLTDPVRGSQTQPWLVSTDGCTTGQTTLTTPLLARFFSIYYDLKTSVREWLIFNCHLNHISPFVSRKFKEDVRPIRWTNPWRNRERRNKPSSSHLSLDYIVLNCITVMESRLYQYKSVWIVGRERAHKKNDGKVVLYKLWPLYSFIFLSCYAVGGFVWEVLRTKQ